MECTKNIYLPGVRKKTLAGDEETRECPGHPIPMPQGRPYTTGPSLPLAPTRLLPPSGTSEALGLLRLPAGALVPAQPSLPGMPEYGVTPTQPASCSTPPVPLCCRCNFVCWHLSVLKACPDQQSDIKKEQIKKLVYFLRQVA